MVLEQADRLYIKPPPPPFCLSAQAEALAVLEQVGQLYIKDHEKEVDEAHRYLPEEARGLVWQQQTPPAAGLLPVPEGGPSSSSVGPASAAAAAEQRGGGFAYGALPPQPAGGAVIVGDEERPVACLLPGASGGGSPLWRLPPLLMPGPCKSRPSLGARLVVQVKGLMRAVTRGCLCPLGSCFMGNINVAAMFPPLHPCPQAPKIHQGSKVTCYPPASPPLHPRRSI